MSLPCIFVLSAQTKNRERLCHWLAALGRRCVALADVDALWAQLKKDRLAPPALLVFDAHPSEESYPLINRLQGDTVGAHLPIVLLTDNLSDSSRRFYSELLHGVECLSKPVSAESLCAVAQICLDMDAARRVIAARMAGVTVADWDQTMSEGLLALDAAGNIRYANQPAARCLRLSPRGLGELNVLTLMETPVVDVDGSWPASALAQALASVPTTELQARSGLVALEIQRLSLWRGDGGRQLVRAALMPLDCTPFAFLFAFCPVDSDDAADQGLAEVARVNLLTGLPTRLHLEEAMASLLRESPKSSNELDGRKGHHPALILLDIDHLRHVNETLGHSFGDQLLRAVAARLRGAREPGLLASMGGGRFALLAGEVVDYRVAGRIAQRLQAQFRLPFLLAGHEVFCHVSIGIALYPASGENAEQLLQGAERALARAKAMGRNVIQFDSSELNRFSIERLERETAFHQALTHGELSLEWRDWKNSAGQVLALQSYAVWADALADRGEIASLAEECGLSRELGDWVFRQTAASSAWPQPLPATMSLVFSVSSAQMLDAFVVKRLSAWMQRHRIPPAQVLLLIPWREDEATVLRQRLPELVSEGVKLALYLNGSGSAPDALATGLWQTMVLGRGYVRRLPPDRALDVISAMVELGHRLGWQVFAEGCPDGVVEEQLFSCGIDACAQARVAVGESE
jgi:diguanylate cyclase (GGDEF)-like protein